MLAGGAALPAALALVVGCGEEPEAQQVTRTQTRTAAPPPPPPKPAVTSVAQLMADRRIDERVMLPEEKAPATTEDRVAVLEFFDAFARADANALGTMLSQLDAVELTALVDSGVWQTTTGGISEIVLEAGVGPYDEKCVLAVFEVNADYQPQLWYYKIRDDGPQFEAVPTPPEIMNKLSGDDWIGAWHALLEEERALANQVELEVEQAPLVLAEGTRRSGGASAPGSQPGGKPAPGFGKPPGGKPDRRPPGKKRKPPGAR